MPDQVVTIRPQLTSFNGKTGYGRVVEVNTTPAADLSDNNDGTGVWMTVADFGAGGWGVFGLKYPPYGTSWNIPAGARVTAIQGRYRMSEVATSGGGDGNDQINAYIGDLADTGDDLFLHYTVDVLAWYPGTITTLLGTAWSRNPVTNADWDLSVLARLGQNFEIRNNDNPSDITLHEVYLDIFYRRAGSVVIDQFPGGVSNTVKPSISWTPAAPDNPGTPQRDAEVRIYTAAMAASAGFNPLDPVGFPPIYDSGIISSSSVRSHQVTVPLPQSVALRAYVFVGQPWPGTDQSGWWSYDNAAFTIVAEKLSVPIVAVVGDDRDASARVDILGAFNLIDQWGSGFEVNPGADWELGPSSVRANAPTPVVGSLAYWTVVANAAGLLRVERGPFVIGAGGSNVQASLKSLDVAANVTINMRWFRADGSFIQEDGAGYAAVGAGGTTRRNINFLPAPAGAVYGTLVFEVQAAAAGNRFQIWDVRLSNYSAWNPVAGFDGFSGITPAKFGMPTRYGDHAMGLSTSSAGQCTGQSLFPITAIQPGTLYAFTSSWLAPAGFPARNITCYIFAYNAANALIGTGTSPVTSEVVGAWVDVTATLVLPAGTTKVLLAFAVSSLAAGELHVMDGATFHPNVAGGYGAGGWATTGTTATFGYELQRSLDGITWDHVLAGDGVVIDPKVQQNSIRDAEVPRGRAVQFRARASASSPTLGDAISDWSAVSATVIRANSARLKCPKRPTLNMEIRLMAPFGPAKKFSLGVFDNVIGRDEPVLFTDGPKGWEGVAKFRLIGIDEHNRFEALINSGEVLLLQDTVGRQWYCRPNKTVTFDELRAQAEVGSPFPIGLVTDISLNFVSTSAPA